MSLDNFRETLSKVISTSLTKKPDTPQIKIENPLAGAIFVNGIDCLFDTVFSRKGELVIEIGNIIVYDSRTGETKNLGKITVGVGKVLRINDDIKIFAWNKSDSNLINAEFKIGLGKTLEPFTSQTFLQNVDVINKFNSEEEIIFPPVVRAEGDIVTKLIDMKGYKSFILNMTPTPISPRTVLRNTIPVDNPDNMIDGNFGTSSTKQLINQPATPPVNINGEIVIDFLNIASRIPKAQIGGAILTLNNPKLWSVIMSVSEDDISYDVVDSFILTNGQNSNINETLEGLQQDFRYIKLVVSLNIQFPQPNNQLRITVIEIFDELTIGGTSVLSFEELDDSSGIFATFIDSSEFLTTSSNVPVKVQIGGEGNFSQTDIIYILPSTQTGFQARMETINGSVGTSVSIRKIA